MEYCRVPSTMSPAHHLLNSSFSVSMSYLARILMTSWAYLSFSCKFIGTVLVSISRASVLVELRHPDAFKYTLQSSIWRKPMPLIPKPLFSDCDCSLLQYINVIANLFIMGNYFNELRWKIIRANNLLQFIHQVTIEIRFRKSLTQERFKVSKGAKIRNRSNHSWQLCFPL